MSPLKNNSPILLNTARNCIRYIIKAFNIKEVYLPFYTCPVVWLTIKKESCKIIFYHIDKDFYPITEFPSDSYIIYTNYFGICSNNVKKLASKYKNLIVDNAQAFYMPKFGIASFNSVRKFFEVPDGACLYTDKFFDGSFDKYAPKNTDRILNEEYLNTEEIMNMSDYTKSIMSKTDINLAKEARLKNFGILNKELSNSNELKINSDKDDVPMYYPYLTYNHKVEQALKGNNIPFEKLWNAMPIEFQEGIFQRYMLLLPIEQKYTQKDMQRIINIIKKNT